MQLSIAATWKTQSGSIIECSDGRCSVVSISDTASKVGWKNGDVFLKEFNYIGDNKFTASAKIMSNGKSAWLRAEILVDKSSAQYDILETDPFSGNKLEPIKWKLLER